MDLSALLAAESDRFLEVLAAVDPDARVPSCPDWSAADLLWHLGEVQHFWSTVIAARPDPPADRGAGEPDRPPTWSGLCEFFRASSARLRDVLARTADDDEPAWTWFPPVQTVGFTRRRQVHEALVHRLDAELAAGLPSLIDAELADDGVDEVLTTMYSQAPPWAEQHDTGPHGLVRCTDTGRTWLVRIGHWSGTSPRSGSVYAAEPMLRTADSGRATFTVEGSAADLDAWLWNRPTAGPVELAGDSAAFEQVIRGGVQ